MRKRHLSGGIKLSVEAAEQASASRIILSCGITMKGERSDYTLKVNLDGTSPDNDEEYGAYSCVNMAIVAS